MTHVVTESCLQCRYTDCVDVCPTDAFRAGRNMLVIAPDDCIDCGVCIPECPVNAIYFEGDVPADQRRFIPINAELSAQWPVICRSQPPLPDADHWAQVQDKAALLDNREALPGSAHTPPETPHG